MNNDNNLFITLEGIDGCGKTTAGYEIKSRLEKRGISVFYTMEPTDDPLGMFIKKYILGNSEKVNDNYNYKDNKIEAPDVDAAKVQDDNDKKNNLLHEYINNLDEISYKLICLFLFSSDRAAHLSSIKNKIKDYDIVICDRFTDSTFAYQSFDKIADKAKIDKAKEFILKVNDFILDINDIKIDKTYLLDIDPKIAGERISKKDAKSLFDIQSIDVFSKIRENYIYLYERYKNRIELINASQTTDKIVSEILSNIDSLLL
jgi:dTMP kinase